MKRKILFLFLVGFSVSAIAQEGSVGIGTQTPNEKAVLHLVAPNNDQGFMVPKLTTSQRNNFSGQLTPNENGMMVYDSDLNQFFFWLIDHWEAVGSSLQAGAGIEIVNGVIRNTGDPDASDDFSGNWTDLSNVPAEFEDGTDNVDDADNDPTNEIQDLNISGDILTITGVGSPTEIDLSVYNSASTDDQDLQFSAGQISLSGDPDNTIIDLSTYDTDASDDFTGDWSDLINVPAAFDDGVDNVDDADSDPTNEIELPATATTGQVLKFDGANWVADTDEFEDGDTDPTNEIELPATASTNDILIFDGTNWVAGTDQVDDADNDPNNEIELPSSAGLGQVLKYNDAAEWAPGTDLVNDADSDPGNELQDLNLSSNILTITGLGSPTEIDLAPFSGTNTDEQDLQFSSEQIRLSGDPDNTIIDLSVYDQTVTAGTGINVNQVGQDFTITNANPDQVVDLAAGSANVTVTGTYPNFTVDVPSLADGDADPSNENQTVTAGTGINVNQVGQDFTITNANPDQVVGLSAGSGNVIVTGTYPNFTVDVPSLADGDADPSNENQTVTAGTGINVNQVGQDFTITNANPDQVVGLSAGSGNVTVTGTYPNFTVDVPSLADGDSDPSNENQTVTAGTGINVNQVGQDFTITNANPDQVVDLAAGSANVTVTGTYPNFTVDVPSLADGDADPSNENQTVTAGTGINVNQVGQDFTITNANPDQVVDLAAGSANVTVTGTYPNFTVDVPSLADGDADPSNENQTVTAGTGINVNQVGQDFTITNANPDQVVGLSAGSGNVTVTGTYPNFTVDVPSLADGDSDPSNENQTVTAGTGINVNQVGQDFIITNANPDQVVDLAAGSANVTVTGTYPNFTVDVPSLADGDADPSNENQTVTAGTGINVNQVGQDFTITNANPDQVVDLAAGSANVTVTGTYPNFTVDVPSLADGDASTSNEIQDLNLEGNNLTLSDDPTPTSIDLGPYLDNTDVLAGLSPSNGQIAKFSRGAWVVADDLVNDNDSDDGNEIQDLDYNGGTNVLTITDNPSATNIDLSGLRNTDLLASIPVDAGDEGSVLKYFPGDGGWTPSSDFVNDFQDISLNDTRIELTNSTSFIDVAGWDRDASDDITTETDPTVPANIKDGIIWSEVGGIPDDIADGDDVNDGDFSSTNEIQTLGRSGNTLSISGGNSVTVLDQYAFKAGKSDRAPQGFSTTAVTISFDSEGFDLGRNYDPGESVFVAPIDGIYNFSGTIGTLVDGGGELTVSIVIGGATQVHTVVRDVNQQDVVTFNTDIRLTRGNQVTVAIRSAGPSGSVVADVLQTNWTGRILLGL